jgi:protein-L-isoaspartate(D-aspartate) O-methyltransferase
MNREDESEERRSARCGPSSLFIRPELFRSARRPHKVINQATMANLRQQRELLADAIDARIGPFAPLYLEAMRAVPRERFVRDADVDRSAEDTPLPLEAGANISAPHIYLITYQLLELAAGDKLVELGTGTGYGAALASFVVGASGRVITFEISEALAAKARENLASLENVTVVQGDAIASSAQWNGAARIVCTFAVSAIPNDWIEALPEGGVLVAPVGLTPNDQELVRVARKNGAVQTTRHGRVHYVRNRGASQHPS